MYLRWGPEANKVYKRQATYFLTTMGVTDESTEPVEACERLDGCRPAFSKSLSEAYAGIINVVRFVEAWWYLAATKWTFR